MESQKEEVYNIDFIKILEKINRKFHLLHASWKEEKQFEIKFRTEIEKNNDDYNALCDKWVDTFSKVTDTVWVKKTSNTGRKVKFRKQYQCWTHGGKVIQKELLFDSRKCKGTLDIKVFCDENVSTRRKNKFCRLGLNVVVQISFLHLHKVDTKEPFAFFVHNCHPQSDVPEQVPMTHLNVQQIESDVKEERSFPASSLTNIPNNKIYPSHSACKSQEQRFDETETFPVEVAVDMQSTTPGHSFMNMTSNSHIIQDNSIMNDTFQVVENFQPQCVNGLKLYYQSGVDQLTQVVLTDSSMNSPLLINPSTFDNMQPLPCFMQTSPSFLCNQTQFLK